MSSSVNANQNNSQPVPASIGSQIKAALGNRKVQVLVGGVVLLTGAAITLGLGLGGVGALSDLSSKALISITASAAAAGVTALIIGKGMQSSAAPAQPLKNRVEHHSSFALEIEKPDEEPAPLSNVDGTKSQQAIKDAEAAVLATQAKKQLEEQQAAALAAQRQAQNSSKKQDAQEDAASTTSSVELDGETELPEFGPENKPEQTDATAKLFEQAAQSENIASQSSTQTASGKRSWGSIAKSTAKYVALGLGVVGLGYVAVQYGPSFFGQSPHPAPSNPIGETIGDSTYYPAPAHKPSAVTSGNSTYYPAPAHKPSAVLNDPICPASSAPRNVSAETNFVPPVIILPRFFGSTPFVAPKMQEKSPLVTLTAQPKQIPVPQAKGLSQKQRQAIEELFKDQPLRR